jgi:predicted MPP superfamily phosphohydrolase
MSASSDIEAKRVQSAEQGNDLGGPLAAEESAGHGGRLRRFQKGTIYWHQAVGGAHVVRGGILARYLENGAQNASPRSGKRELGFPRANEKRSPDGVCQVQHFEWGAIYHRFGGTILHGEIYTKWNALNRVQTKSPGPYGYPIDDQQVIAGGEAAFFERGAWWMDGEPGASSKPGFVQWRIKMPLLGRPAIVTPDVETFPVSLELEPASVPPQGPQLPAGSPPLPIAMWQGRLFLQPVRQDLGGDSLIPIQCVSPPTADAAFLVRLRLPSGVQLADRTLYSLLYKNPKTGRTHVLAPHAIYAKSSWESFGFAHITDTHVSKRLDKFRDKLVAAGRESSARKFNNFNDNFRDFVIYANRLHAKGELDAIFLTGDVVDYQLEKGDVPGAGGNFELFMKLVRGQSAYEDNPAWASTGAQALRVPIFVTLGNHDYRRNPYYLRCRLEYMGTDTPMKNYGNMNLVNKDALTIMGTDTPGIGPDEAKRMVEVNRDIEFCKNHILGSSSYTVNLGDHRVVMLDSGPDAGVVDDVIEYASVELLGGSESQDNFISGAPDSEGVSSSELLRVQQALNTTNDGSLVLVCIHAPLINPHSTELPPYFRETVLGSGPRDEILGFLLRRDRKSFVRVSGASIICDREKGRGAHASWMAIDQNEKYFKRGTTEDLLDYGVSAGSTDALLQACAGIGTARRADLVMSGHGHMHAEFRVTPQGNNGVRFYFDFYTDNPTEYYYTATHRFAMPETWPENTVINLFQSPVRVFVGPQAQPPREDQSLGWMLVTPDYANPLNKTDSVSEARDWWNDHRPLVTQTSALGPIENSQREEKPFPIFQGFRFGRVRQNTIVKLHTVRLVELRQNNLKMPWEQGGHPPVVVVPQVFQPGGTRSQSEV